MQYIYMSHFASDGVSPLTVVSSAIRMGILQSYITKPGVHKKKTNDKYKIKKVPVDHAEKKMLNCSVK